MNSDSRGCQLSADKQRQSNDISVYQFILGGLRNKFVPFIHELINMDTSHLMECLTFCLKKKELALALYMLNAKQGNYWYHFIFSLTRPRIKLVTSHTRLKRMLYQLSYWYILCISYANNKTVSRNFVQCTVFGDTIYGNFNPIGGL